MEAVVLSAPWILWFVSKEVIGIHHRWIAKQETGGRKDERLSSRSKDPSVL
jgi:hypothetical protein